MMNSIDDEEEQENEDDDRRKMTVDQCPSVRPPLESNNNKNICSIKQTSVETDRTKYHPTNRSTSLPSRQSFSSDRNNEENFQQRRRYASDSSNRNNKNTTTETTLLVTSFIQYLRSELRTTMNDQKYIHSRIQKKKSSNSINNLSQSNYMSSLPFSTSSSLEFNLNENIFQTNHDDHEILNLINLLVLRVEYLANENSLINNKKSSTIKQIDQNLIEYLYYLFNKFIDHDPDLNKPMIDKTNFVHVCQTLVRNGCFNIPSTTSPDQSFSEMTITHSSDLTSTQTFVHEYRKDIDEMSLENSLLNEQISSTPINDQDTWLVVDLEAIKSEYSPTNSDRSDCLLPSSTSDEQFLLPNESYFSFEELKSCESESSHSNYYSPNSSLIDIQNMVQEFDELNNTNNNNNILFNEDGSSRSSSTTSSIEHALTNTNVIKEVKDSTISNNNICTGFTNDCEHVSSSSSSTDSNSSMSSKDNEKIFRREKKMQERWSTTTKTSTNNNESSSTKPFLGVEFPPIAVLRRKFSSLPSPPQPTILNPLPLKKKDSSSTKLKSMLINSSQDNNDNSTILPTQNITPIIVDKTKYDLESNDTSSLNDCKTNDTQQLLTDMTIKPKDEEKPILSSVEYQKEIIPIINSPTLIIDSCNLNSPSLPSSSLSSISSSLTINMNENKSSEFLLKEIEEEKEKKEEEYRVDDNIDGEKKNNCNIEEKNDHASTTILINGELTQAVLLEQEKKEKEEEQEQVKEQPSSLLPTSDLYNQSQSEDESSIPIFSTNLEKITMTNIDENDQRYKKIEIEEIPDEDDDLSIYNNHLIEPTDCILTDDELKISKQSSSKSNIKTTNPVQIDPVLSCHENPLSKPVETIDNLTKLTNETTKESQLPPKSIKRIQRPEDDPIALRALERFEQRMNAAATKPNNDETNLLVTKGKSSWSSTPSTPRKSVENLFNPNQSSELNSNSNIEQSTTATPQRDSFIRPRKTMLDDIGLNFGMTLNLFNNDQSNSTDDNNNNHHHQQQPKLEEQQQPTAIVVAEDDNKSTISNESTVKNLDSEDHQHPQEAEEQQRQPPPKMSINSSLTNESSFNNEGDNSNSLVTPSFDGSSTNSSLNTIISHSSSSEQQSLTPYRLQLEGRRRLNTLERYRERRQLHESNDLIQHQQQQQQILNEYTVKPEDLQDPIIRRALERFDEKSRSLSQSRSHNYNDIQDPITRRALMRLDTNLKRTIPSHPSTTNQDSNETWYTNSYTLGSLQSTNGHHYPQTSVPSTLNYKPTHVSVHQRFNSTSSSDMTELPTNNILSNNESDIPIMRVPTQPIYVTSNNQQQQQSINFRQRSRSEDLLSSRDLPVSQTTLDENDTTQLQQNHLSDELQQKEEEQQQQQQQDISVSNPADIPLPNTIIKSLEPNFVRTAEASINYATPTQSYSAYSCEYTRPHQNQLPTAPKSEVLIPRNIQQENDIQYPIPPSSSAFTPVHPITNNNHNSYIQQPLSTPSYNSMYTSNNLNQTPYSDDPIVRRALERFNCQMQNSLINMAQHQPNTSYMSRQFTHGYPSLQGNFDSIHPSDPNQYESWINSHRSMQPPSSTSTGYQSIIGRRRQMRHDDVYHDHTSVGNGYATSLFINPQNSYPYMNYSDEPPPVIPPRLHRDIYHEYQQQQDYLSENVNNNNNNNNNAYIHHPYPPTMNGFRPVITHQYLAADYLQQFQEEEYLRHRAQSTSSNTSSDSTNPIRLIHQRLPPTSTRTNLQQNNNLSPDDAQLLSGQTSASVGSATGDSVFQRLAYTATKSSLSKSSSNLCTNLLNKIPQQQMKSTNFKAQEIDFDESTLDIENSQELNSSSTTISNKCQRSRSVDGRARLKNAQNRINNTIRSTNDYDDNNHSNTVPSSKFTSITPRRDVAPAPPRFPITPRSSLISDRTSLAKRVPNGNNISYTKNGNSIRARGSNGNLIDTENDENLSFNDNYQPKIIDSKTRIGIPVQRYPSNNHNNIQTSASTSSVNSTNSRTKVPVPTSTNILSPNGQRRTIPVSVFAPAKLENKSPASNLPSSTSPTNESNLTLNSESQQQQEQLPPPPPPQSSSSSSSSTGDSSSPTITNENEINNKFSSTNSARKSSTGDILNELSLTNDKHDTNKKMNVFERLFRGHKKKV